MGKRQEIQRIQPAVSMSRKTILWSTAGLFAATLLSGCMTTRAASPGLPYVEPAVSVPNQNPDPATFHLSARLQELDQDMQRVRDSIERLQAQSNTGLEKTVGDLQQRVSFIERQLGIETAAEGRMRHAQQPTQELKTLSPGPSPAIEPPPASAKQSTAASPPPDVPMEIVEAPAPPEEKLYREAYATLKQGEADKAAGLFEEFLKKNPSSPLASDAVYWIGEAKYATGRFPEAVLQFDRVIREFPGSRKELNALLKQGLAFEKMGDRRSAKIIFQKLVQQSPHTSQARIAATRLKALPSE